MDICLEVSSHFPYFREAIGCETDWVWDQAPLAEGCTKSETLFLGTNFRKKLLHILNLHWKILQISHIHHAVDYFCVLQCSGC